MISAFLGISVGSPYYSRERIRHYLSWAKINYGSLAFLVGDCIAKYTIAATRHLDLKQAEARALQIGDNVCTMLRSVSATSGITTEILRWSDVEAIPQYDVLLKAAEREFAGNLDLRKAVRHQVWTNLGSRLAVVGVADDASQSSLAAEYCDRYVIEEIAGLITVSEFTKYSLELYPGKDLEVLGLIYANRFPAISTVLPSVRHRGFQELRINT